MKKPKLCITVDSGSTESSISLNSADIKSLLNCKVPMSVVLMLQAAAKEKIMRDLKEAEADCDIKKSNQVLVDSGLYMFALFSEKGDRSRKNPKSMIFLAKDITTARREHGPLSGYGRRAGVIAQWSGAVPTYVMRIVK